MGLIPFKNTSAIRHLIVFVPMSMEAIFVFSFPVFSFIQVAYLIVGTIFNVVAPEFRIQKSVFRIVIIKSYPVTSISHSDYWILTTEF